MDIKLKIRKQSFIEEDVSVSVPVYFKKDESTDLLKDNICVAVKQHNTFYLTEYRNDVSGDMKYTLSKHSNKGCVLALKDYDVPLFSDLNKISKEEFDAAMKRFVDFIDAVD